MLIAGIIFFLLILSAIVLYLRYRGVRLAYIWLIFIISVFSVWLILLIIQPDKTAPWIIENWGTIGISSFNLSFQINNTNWPMSFSFVSLLLAFLLSSIVRLNGIKSMYEWVEMVVLIVFGWVVLLAGDYWSILIGWTLIDFVEIVFHFRHKELNPDKFYIHFLLKFLGSLVLIFGISRSFQINPIGLFEKKVEGIGLIIPLAAFLHSGILTKFSEKYDQEISSHKIIIFLRIISFITSFFILVYVPAPSLGMITNLVIKIFLFLLAVFQIYEWALAKEKFPSFRRLLLAFGAVLCLIFLSGFGKFIAIWLILLIVPFGGLYLYTDRDPKFHGYLFLSGFFISGFPYSLTFQGLSQLLVQGQWINLFFVFIPITIAISGYIHHGLKKIGNINGIEPWYQIFYQIGLFFPLISTIVIITRSLNPPVNSLSSWWLGFTMILLSILLYLFHFRVGRNETNSNEIQQRNYERISNINVGFHYIIKKILLILDNSLLFFSSLFEDEGGILWSIVFLILFITILKFQGGI